MEIKDLHKSISQMDESESFQLIRYLRSLRRQLLDIPAKKSRKKKEKKVKVTKDRINQGISKMSKRDQGVLLQKLLKLKERKKKVSGFGFSKTKEHTEKNKCWSCVKSGLDLKSSPDYPILIRFFRVFT